MRINSCPVKCSRNVDESGHFVDGDSYAMGVAAQITEHMLWASERTFRVDHSVLSEQWSEFFEHHFAKSGYVGFVRPLRPQTCLMQS
jgi:hypothetical protein